MKSISKSTLRKMLLDYRRLLKRDVYVERNQLLCQNIVDLIIKNDFKTIHTFLPIERNQEPDVRSLILHLEVEGRKMIASTTNFSDRTQLHFYVDSQTKFIEDKMGIPEPLDADSANFSDVDCILVPLLASDNNGNRIGYGGGFYDQLLANTSAFKVGLSLTPSLDQIVQLDEWDVKLDLILTPF